uniref:Uncharacterized protein n=1 Tax=Glossina pallidipes TaxID=7398 RepID=A0A1A9ZF83_GLOPL
MLVASTISGTPYRGFSATALLMRRPVPPSFFKSKLPAPNFLNQSRTIRYQMTQKVALGKLLLLLALLLLLLLLLDAFEDDCTAVLVLWIDAADCAAGESKLSAFISVIATILIKL